MTELKDLLKGPVEFGSFLRAAREAKKLTQQDLAKACGLKPAQIEALENKTAFPPSDRMIMQMTMFLEVDPDLGFVAAGRLPPDMRCRLPAVVLCFREFHQQSESTASGPTTNSTRAVPLVLPAMV